MLRASRDEALTDSLTGLGNRRALTRELDEALAEADAESPLVLALFDLDGFKHYNDTFGHPAGDVLLTRLGANLRRTSAPAASVFRMGGDEFCALFEPRLEDRATLLDGAALALSRAGRGLLDRLLLRLDLAPERGGRHRRGAPRRRPAHVRPEARRRACPPSARSRRPARRRSVDARPGAREALSAVADLAEATARHLGLGARGARRPSAWPPSCTTSARWRIPEESWPSRSADRRGVGLRPPPHLAGERIIAAAPALAQAARLVARLPRALGRLRLPGRPRRHQIPLGARIVAVADAFDAMPRPPDRAALTKPTPSTSSALRGHAASTRPCVEAFTAATRARARAGRARLAHAHDNRARVPEVVGEDGLATESAGGRGSARAARRICRRSATRPSSRGHGPWRTCASGRRRRPGARRACPSAAAAAPRSPSRPVKRTRPPPRRTRGLAWMVLEARTRICAVRVRGARPLAPAKMNRSRRLGPATAR